MNPQDKVILIVGASSGIGYKLATQLADEGALLAVTARRQDRLRELQTGIEQRGGRCFALAADALDESASEEVVRKVVDHYGRIDVVILNAGGAPAIDMRMMGAAEVRHYMRTNYDVSVNYLFPVLEQMKKQRRGLVVQTNSLAGFLGVPLQGPYSAAKGALKLLIDTCRLEFHEYGIGFVSVYPGFVATEATQDDGMPAPMEISAEQAARYIIRGIRREKPDYLFPGLMRWTIRLLGIVPPSLVRWVLRRDVPRMVEEENRASS
ncbi:SDR family NAD(P)-dependent oxidoreductase [Amphritea pacifica]|uniref:SDR family NAD(P)-dependent oxidoreductase n=1 Tax=Amphritea pacifica TaxID=2811233 RepID=UPI0019661478|nr:SDR family NAD(P)-dependent oxidoreductase [Amphritea pacifica]MBN1009062.1 SDR family NAD(P)-dependent oxidoreductase [Amphritea pacifica]